MTSEEFALMVNDHEHEIGSLKNRIDDVEKRQDALNKLAESVGRMDAAAIVLTDEQAAKSCFSTCRMIWSGISLRR